ncbi:GNAT family N-acetyltransferase [Halobacteriovorax sp. RZ-1]|uniref:GNAT family N-acetyltransferase n=1 Tax=unclassified Halobacteriovorax TaxID=2639665 RepID=UPI00371A0318
MEIKFLESGNPEICNTILRSLPKWFGIEEAIVDYVNKSKEMAMLVAYESDEVIGFLSIKEHGEFSCEIYVMGILSNYHRKGIGQLLVAEAEKVMAQKKFEFLQVKTVDSLSEDEYYRKTRLFYEALGFKKLEVFPTLWDEHNPCLLLVKSLV